MKPIGNNVLCKPFPSEEISLGGIIIPDSAKQVNNKMTVVESGGKSKFKKGEIVYRVRDWGTEIKINGESHFLMADNSLLAKE